MTDSPEGAVPVETGPLLEEGSVEVASSGPGRLGSVSAQMAWEWFRDLVAVVVVVWPLWWLADNDGGRFMDAMGDYVWFLLFAIPVLASEVRRLHRWARIPIWAVPLGALISLAFAWDRALFVQDAQVFAAMPVAALAGARLWRRPHGHLLLAGVLAVSWFGWFWLGMLKWWGWSDLGLQPRWELVSWRNQSGILTGAFGLAFTGMALLGKRTLALVATVLAGSAFAGVWLSTSRGAVIFTALTFAGMALVAFLVHRGEGKAPMAVLARTGGVALATLLMVGALSAMLPAGTVSPIDSRTQGVAKNAVHRAIHWEAAVGMFQERPLAGQGIGSYRNMASRHTRADGFLTASTHSEWLEAYAEGGLAFGLPMTLLALLLALMPFGLVRAGREQADDEFGLRRGLLVGMAAAAFAIAAHASVDFNFGYPSVAMFMAVGGGVVASALWRGEHEPATDEQPPLQRLVLPTLLVLPGLVLGAMAAYGASTEVAGQQGTGSVGPMELATFTAPWDVEARMSVTQQLLLGGQPDAARVAAQGAVDWNPHNPRAVMNLARVDLILGNLTAQEVVDLLEPPPTVLGEWVRTADTLLQTGHLDLADEVAQRTINFHPEYERWGITRTVADAWIIRLRVAAAQGRCSEVPALAAAAVAHDEGSLEEADQAMVDLSRELCPAS